VLFSVEEATSDVKPISQIQDQHGCVVIAADCCDDAKTLFFAPRMLMLTELLGDPSASGGRDDTTTPTLKIVWPLFVSNLETDGCSFFEGNAGQDASLAVELSLEFSDFSNVREGVVAYLDDPRERLFIG